LEEIRADLPDLQRVILLDEPDAVADSASIPGFETSRYSDLLSDREDNPGVPVGPRDPAAVLFTSGTTGPSKAVLMPHAQLYFFAEEMIQVTNLSEDDAYLTSFPFFHANAQVESIYPALVIGIRCVLYRKFSASDWIGRIRRSGATVTNHLGATLAFVAAQPESADDRDHKLRCIFAVPMPEGLCARIAERFGVASITSGFGQTEISMPFLTPPGAPVPSGSCGVLLDQWFEVALDKGDGSLPAEGPAVGELLVRQRAPGIMCDGFFGMPEKTVEAWRDLWFHTGDLVRRDAEGWYYFVDRLKDTLRRRGENISSFEIEDVVRSHPLVAECAIVGVPADEEGGEDEVMCFIVVTDGASIDPQELLEFCRPRMPGFALPRYIEALSELPKTPSEKVKKDVLRQRGVGPATFDSQSATA
jgi:crotonobetaine/carnitine-CoA ligase